MSERAVEPSGKPPPSPPLETTALLTTAKADPTLEPKPRIKSTRWSRQLRANNILGKLIPALIFVLAIKGYNLVVFETGKPAPARAVCDRTPS